MGPLDRNVHEGRRRSSAGPAGGKPFNEDGPARTFPDFTRGQWQPTKPAGIIAQGAPSGGGGIADPDGESASAIFLVDRQDARQAGRPVYIRAVPIG